MVTEEAVLEVLKSVYDPEIPINIVDMGLIYGIEVKGDHVNIKMTLTAPHCPMGALIAENVKQKVETIDGVSEAEVELVWDPPWSPDRILKESMKQLTEE